MKHFVIGDIHGCIRELDLMLKCLDQPGNELIFTGDFMDKGPHPRLVLERLHGMTNVQMVQGNHENKHMRYHAHEAKKKLDPKYKNPMKPTDDFLRARKDVLESDIDLFSWLDTKCQQWIRIDEPKSLIVHAGVVHGWPVEKMQKQKLYQFVRRLRPDNSVAHLEETGDDLVYWTERYAGDETVYYGHIPWPEVRFHNNTIGVDTGCVHGGKLSAVCIETKQIVSIVSEKEWYPIHI